MRLHFSLAISFCLISQQAFSADLCQSVTARLRMQPDFISGERGLSQSVLENPGTFRQVRDGEGSMFDRNFDSYLAVLARKYHLPSIPEADGGFTRWRIEAAPSTPFFTSVAEFGVRGCQDFVLYRRGDPASRLGERGLSCDSLGVFGLLVSTPVLIAHNQNALDYSEQFSITPVTSGRWEAACEIKARFEPQFRVAHTFVAPGGISKEEFSALALEFTRLRGLKEDGPAQISLGELVSDSVAASIRSMATTIRIDWKGELPQFGGMEQTGGHPPFRELHPIMFQGRPYGMQFVFGTGLHNLPVPEAYLILFEPRDGRLVPAASAEVDISRGKLLSLN